MAIFKGTQTPRQPAPPTLEQQYFREKLVRANPKHIRRRDSDGPTENTMNEWDLKADPTNSKFLCYRVLVFYAPRWNIEKPFRVVVSLNINDSMHRFFKTFEEAMQRFDEIKSYTTKKTLYNRGFRWW